MTPPEKKILLLVKRDDPPNAFEMRCEEELTVVDIGAIMTSLMQTQSRDEQEFLLSVLNKFFDKEGYKPLEQPAPNAVELARIALTSEKVLIGAFSGDTEQFMDYGPDLIVFMMREIIDQIAPDSKDKQRRLFLGLLLEVSKRSGFDVYEMIEDLKKSRQGSPAPIEPPS